jgi:toxin HigB-1
MIRSFSNKLTEDLYHGRGTKRAGRVAHGVRRAVERKLDMLEAAVRLDDLRAPPGNRLEALRGDLDGFHSIRVNDQWRIVFRWSEGGADEVRLVDYH